MHRPTIIFCTLVAAGCADSPAAVVPTPQLRVTFDRAAPGGDVDSATVGAANGGVAVAGLVALPSLGCEELSAHLARRADTVELAVTGQTRATAVTSGCLTVWTSARYGATVWGLTPGRYVVRVTHDLRDQNGAAWRSRVVATSGVRVP